MSQIGEKAVLNCITLPIEILNNNEVLEELLTEINFSYKVKIDTTPYNYMNYNFNFKFTTNETKLDQDGIDKCSNHLIYH